MYLLRIIPKDLDMIAFGMIDPQLGERVLQTMLSPRKDGWSKIKVILSSKVQHPLNDFLKSFIKSIEILYEVTLSEGYIMKYFDIITVPNSREQDYITWTIKFRMKKEV